MGLRKGWIELWTGRMKGTPPESDDAPHSASIGLRAPTIRASIEHKQPVSCSNRNMNWAGMSTIRAPGHILHRDELSTPEPGYRPQNGDKTASDSDDGADLLLRASWVSPTLPSTSSSGGRYIPKRPR